MKSIVLSVFVIMITLSLTFYVSLASTEPQIVVNQESGSPGDTVSLTVSLSSNPGLQTLTFDVNYDKSILTLDTYQLGTLLDMPVPPQNGVNTYPLTFALEASELSADVTADGVLLTLNFTISSTASAGSTEISISGVGATNYNLARPIFLPVNGLITVQTDTSATTSTPTAINTLIPTETSTTIPTETGAPIPAETSASTTTSYSENIPGGYTVDRAVTDDDLQVFNEAMNGFVGVSYEPTLVATQVVSGTKYRFTATATPVVLNPVPYKVYVYLYKPLQGPAQLIEIVNG